MRANTDWFRDARWGVFFHFLAAPASSQAGGDVTADAWNCRVDAFDVKAVGEQLASAGAGYTVLTLGQGSGHFCAPNATYDGIVGRKATRLSERDLPMDLADALEPYGIPLLVYASSHAPYADAQAVEALGCTPRWREDAHKWSVQGDYPIVEGTDDRLTNFQRTWESILREWSERWGGKVRGWWIDGVYFADRMYRFDDEPNFASFAAALKAGNPESIVAFNSGISIPVVSITEHEDYTAGELNSAFPTDIIRPPKFAPVQRWVAGAQYHVLCFMGGWWGQGAPRMCAEFVVGATRDINAREGVVSWDVPLDEGDLIPDAFMDRLRALGKATRR